MHFLVLMFESRSRYQEELNATSLISRFSLLFTRQGERHALRKEIENTIWSETAVSATLRAILDDNDEPDGNEGKPLLGLRKLDPLPTPQAEKRFLAMAADEFWKCMFFLTN
jgi:hypothetical protein